ncbi:hypothetical protein A5320_18230 [Rheinheimera sp. SA_1]|nr:hypothetical protein A5320_18230 [Rheinheimera sp. SA_1]
MLFLAIVMVGFYAWLKIPVELVPAVSGDQLFVRFYRPGADPEVVERDILKPLESRASQLAGVVRTWAQINGSEGSFNIEFEPGSNYRVRELELRRLAASLQREQPEGSQIRVSSQDSTALSRFVLSIQVIGGDDINVIRELVDNSIRPHLEATPGVGRVLVFGGARRELTISIDNDKAAQYGITVNEITTVLRKATDGQQLLGGVEVFDQRLLLVIDHRPETIEKLAELQIRPDLPVRLGELADISLGNEPRRTVSKVNGAQAVSLMILQQQDGNLIELGAMLRARLAALSTEYQPYGIRFHVSFDAAEKVAEQLYYLKHLALSGFLIALLVLTLFVRDLRAAAVVASAVPVSLLAAGAMLYLGGYSLNIITLFGLVIGVGMLVDNSIVVYEAVQRSLERGTAPEQATILGGRRTLRAILTASATNAVVFLPLLYIKDMPVLATNLFSNIVPAILYPLLASLLVAIGLVPLLTYRFVAPLTRKELQRATVQRLHSADAASGNVVRELFCGLLKNAMRQPAALLAGVIVSLLLTLVIALPWVLVQTMSQQQQEQQQLRVEVELNTGGSLEAASRVFEQLEFAVLNLEGISTVESNHDELQGSLTINLLPAEKRPPEMNASRVHRAINAVVEQLGNVQIRPLSTLSTNDENSESLTDQSLQIGIAGRDMQQLNLMAKQLKERLAAIPFVGSVNLLQGNAVAELHVVADHRAMSAYRLLSADVYATLFGLGREGVRLPHAFLLPDDSEVPLVIRRQEKPLSDVTQSIEDLPLHTGRGVIMLGDLVQTARNIPPQTISHYNGRREVRLAYRLDDDAPVSGPERFDLQRQIDEAIEAVYQPPGYTIEIVSSAASQDWLRLVMLPAVLLLYALLAIAFESLMLPLLILIAVPLTILGAVWALVLNGLGLDMMAGLGVIVLLGLTVNPAILIVDRMQQKRRSSDYSAGKAAMSAAVERVRPVLMTTCTTVAGLWPLALSKGHELELWPPFATIVIGGLTVSTLLTLLVLPIGYVLLSRLEANLRLLGWWKLAAVALAAACGALLPYAGQLYTDVYWGTALFCALFALLCYGCLALHGQPGLTPPATGSMTVETRYLSKTYNMPGPFAKAWHKHQLQAARSGRASVAELKQRMMVAAPLVAGAWWLTISLQTAFWHVCCAMLSGILSCRLLLLCRSLWCLYRGDTTKDQGLFAKRLWVVMPWLVLSMLWFYGNASQVLLAAAALMVLLLQSGRRTARLCARGELPRDPGAGLVNAVRRQWRGSCMVLFSFGLSDRSFTALYALSVTIRPGMTGVLGPNGAGKTTLFRLLSTVLGSTCGTIYYAHYEKRTLGQAIAQLVGFLPQEFGLPGHLTAREYLEYFAILYGIGNRAQRSARVEELLDEVGLADKQHDCIASYSGGMRQRVAVARTLLNHPPVILVDEPTAGLDPRERIRFRNLLAKLAKDRVVLFSTHVVEDVAVACDRVLVIKNGRLLFDGKPVELMVMAQGRVWQLRLPQVQAHAFERQHHVIVSQPEPNYMMKLRVMADSQPHPSAELAEPTLEDGYLAICQQHARS